MSFAESESLVTRIDRDAQKFGQKKKCATYKEKYNLNKEKYNLGMNFGYYH